MAKKTLKEMRDELRLRIHLAEMDAKSTWQKLQPRLRELERKASRAGAAVRSSLRSLKSQLESPRR